jgi:3',5'-cyclic AMP phosphodiesterase CpdA
MMYLVDLDDTMGYKITLVPKESKEVVETKTNGEMDAVIPEQVPNADDADDTMGTGDLTKPALNDGEIATLSQQIIDDARTQLDALLRGRESPKKRMKKLKSSLYVAGGIPDRNEGGGAF